MATEKQLQDLTEKLKTYKRKYLRKEFAEVNEPATRIMINYLLTDILGYKELEEVKTEYRIRSEYADYVIQVKRKKHFVVEVKSIDIDLNDHHLKQARAYAADEGIDWIVLTNGREIQLHRVSFTKPIKTTLIYKLDLLNSEDFKKAPQQIWYLTKTAVEHGDLEKFWKQSDALQLEHIAKVLYCEDVVRRLRTELKYETDIYFQLEDVSDALFELITQAVKIQAAAEEEPAVRVFILLFSPGFCASFFFCGLRIYSISRKSTIIVSSVLFHLPFFSSYHATYSKQYFRGPSLE